MRFFATANGYVVSDPAVGVITTRSGAWIYATVTRTALIAWAVSVEHTFRPTRAERIADIISWTDAVDCSVLRLALCVGTARIGIARLRW